MSLRSRHKVGAGFHSQDRSQSRAGVTGEAVVKVPREETGLRGQGLGSMGERGPQCEVKVHYENGGPKAKLRFNCRQRVSERLGSRFKADYREFEVQEGERGTSQDPRPGSRPGVTGCGQDSRGRKGSHRQKRESEFAQSTGVTEVRGQCQRLTTGVAKGLRVPGVKGQSSSERSTRKAELRSLRRTV